MNQAKDLYQLLQQRIDLLERKEAEQGKSNPDAEQRRPSVMQEIVEMMLNKAERYYTPLPPELQQVKTALSENPKDAELFLSLGRLTGVQFMQLVSGLSGDVKEKLREVVSGFEEKREQEQLEEERS